VTVITFFWKLAIVRLDKEGVMSTAFSDLRVWQRPMDLACEVYQSTREFLVKKCTG
jgi:hypothetical protein